MNGILTLPSFQAAYERLAQVSLNPRRHTSPNARAHSETAASVARRLGEANGCSPSELRLLEDLGRAHDVGKVTGSARPEHSLEVLRECRVDDPGLLALVKWHDVGLPWFLAAQRGQAASEKAWRRLAREVDLRLLCLFAVADRSDAPGGWRRNAPTLWLLGEARRRGLIPELTLDLPDHPSLISAGGALVREAPGSGSRELLLIRVRESGFELPKGGIEWDEAPEAAAVRETLEESGVRGNLRVGRRIADLDHRVEVADKPVLKRVRYFALSPDGPLEMGVTPPRTRERRWIALADAETVMLAIPELRPLLRAALGEE